MMHKKIFAFSEIAKGDFIGVFCDDSRCLNILLALWQVGAVAVLLSKKDPITIVNSKIKKTNCKAVFVFDEITAKSIEQLEVRVVKSYPNISFDKFNIRQIYDQNLPATVIFTSSTTGEAKAVVHSMRQHFASAKNVCEHLSIDQDSKLLISIPMWHIGGLSIFIRSLFIRCAVFFMDKPQNIINSIAANQISHISLVPTQLIRLLQDKNHVKILQKTAIIIGGAPCSQYLLQKARNLSLPIVLSYGCTEMASQIATTAIGSDIAGCGKVLPGIDLMISDDDEILVRGPSLCRGYFRDGKINSVIDESGYYPTGDCGKIDVDNNLFITGRKDNMFVWGGENIFCEEIERAVLQISEIEQAVVVPVTDKEYGCIPIAFIRSSRSLTDDYIIKKVLNFLPKFKVPKKYYSWPKNMQKTLKINRKVFAELAVQYLSTTKEK